MDQTVDERAPEQAGLQRRTLLKGAAWSVPAVLLVGATPAFAASNLALRGATTLAVATPGPGIVYFDLVALNDNSVPISITSISATSTGTTPWNGFSLPTVPINVPASSGTTPGASQPIRITASRSSNTNQTYPLQISVIYSRGTQTGLTAYWNVNAGYILKGKNDPDETWTGSGASGSAYQDPSPNA